MLSLGNEAGTLKVQIDAYDGRPALDRFFGLARHDRHQRILAIDLGCRGQTNWVRHMSQDEHNDVKRTNIRHINLLTGNRRYRHVGR